jgi:hypothetical protein
MTTEELLLEKWRTTLPPAKQKEVLAFTDRLIKPSPTADSPLGEKLRAIRARILESGSPLLSDAELEREIAERRGERDTIGLDTFPVRLER